MAAYFFDSSAMVKRYVREAGTAWVVNLVRNPNTNVFYVARIVSAEAVSAFARRRRDNSLTAKHAAKIKRRFLRDFQQRFFKIEIDAALIQAATELTDKYPLRGYDAVQLAAALKANNARIAVGASTLTFVSADNALNAAAQSENLRVENPNNYP